MSAASIANHYPILTPHEFIAQGTSAAAIASIARYLEEAGNPNAARVRQVAEDVAAINGAQIYGKRGYYVPAPRRMKPANNNRRVRRAA